jgi:VanZ family protein
MKASRGRPSQSLDEKQLAMVSGMVLDIPPRVRLVLMIAAVTGVGLALMQSLVGHQPGSIGIDKLIHFSGYALLAAVFVLALRPVLFIPVLLGLLAMSFGIECLQPLTGRERDVHDFVANALGLAIGAGLGLAVRGMYGWMRRDLAIAAANRKRMRCHPGAVLLRQGELVRSFHIIQSGTVKMVREVDGKEHELVTLGPGDVIGLLGVVQDTPQYATATAQTAVTVYRLGLDELIENSGGAGLPVTSVLQAVARLLRSLGDQVVEIEKTEGLSRSQQGA